MEYPTDQLPPRSNEWASSIDWARVHDVFVEAILTNIPDSWDDDTTAEDIALRYVRVLEERVLALGGSLERVPDDPAEIPGIIGRNADEPQERE